MGSRKDPAWKYGTEIPNPSKGYKYIECNFCKQGIKGGVGRMKDHLAGTHKNARAYPKVPKEVKQEMLDYLKKGTAAKQKRQEQFDDMVDAGAYYGSGSAHGSNPSHEVDTRSIRGPMDKFLMHGDDDIDETHSAQATNPPQVMSQHAKEARRQVALDIGRFFFENGISFNCIESPSFVSMCRSIALYGKGLRTPSRHELSTWILKEEVKTTKICVEEVKKTWIQTGVSILSDGWKDMRGRSLINILINNPYGTVFLKSVDVSDVVKDANYKEIWDIIDAKWENQLHCDLHAAAHFLNPRHQYSPNFSSHHEIKKGLMFCMEKLIPRDDMLKADLQLDAFRTKLGLFGLTTALESYKTRSPADWWIQYGDSTSELQSFAVKVLSLTCAASACERNWSMFNQVHTKKRNRLTTCKLNSLVYIMYNRRLRAKHFKVKSRAKDKDPLEVDHLASDDEWYVGNENEPNQPNEPSGSVASIIAQMDDDNDQEIEADLDNTQIPNEGASSSSRTTSKKRNNSTNSKGQSKKGRMEMNLIDEEEEEDEEEEDGDEDVEEILPTRENEDDDDEFDDLNF